MNMKKQSKQLNGMKILLKRKERDYKCHILSFIQEMVFKRQAYSIQAKYESLYMHSFHLNMYIF